MILIDGNGYLFHEHYVRLGVQGGEVAAHLLREKIHHYFDENDFPGQGNWELKIRILLNVEKLSKAMRDVGYISDSESLALFFRGFTRVEKLFDMIDISYDNHGAKHKIEANSTRISTILVFDALGGRDRRSSRYYCTSPELLFRYSIRYHDAGGAQTHSFIYVHI